MLPSSSWVSLAAPAEPFGWWIHKASLLERAILRPPFRGGCSAPRGSPSSAAAVRAVPAARSRSPPIPPGARAAGPILGPTKTQRSQSGLRVPGASRGCGKEHRNSVPVQGASRTPKYGKLN